MTALCGKKPPVGLGACGLPKGHGGDFHEDGPYTWPTRQAAQKRNQTARARVNRESAKQAYRRGRLEGIRDQRLADQRDAYEQGRDHPTAKKVEAPSWCEVCGKPTPAENLRIHHVIFRSHGVRATPETQGDERIEDLILTCRPCHDENHPGPWNR